MITYATYVPAGKINEQWLILAEGLVNQVDPIASGTQCSLVAQPRYAEVARVWEERRR